MKPLLVQDQTWTCRFEATWPPGAAYLGESPESLRAQGALTETAYQRYKVWERDCEQLRMAEKPCASCENLVVDGVAQKQVSPQQPPPPSHRRWKP